MVDIDSLTADPTSADFVFNVNQAAAPDTWSTAPAPASITRSVGTGVDGSDRVKIIWADGDILNQWIEVTVLATSVTGLASADVFYFGNASGDGDGDGLVDDNEFNTFKSQFGLSGAIGTLQSDYNGDGNVNLGDFIAMRERFGGPGVLAPTPPAPAPLAAAAPGSDVATADEPLVESAPAAAPSLRQVSVGPLAAGLELSQLPVDLFVELQSNPTPAADTPALLAATDQTDLRPLSDETADDDSDDLLTDILAESALVIPL
jgi:hypothetical protein